MQFRSWIAAASITLMGCATAAAPESASEFPPPELRGCWIERRGDETLTMRWFPGEDGTWWRGEFMSYRQGDNKPESATYTLGIGAGENQGQSWDWIVCGPAAGEARCLPADLRQTSRGGDRFEVLASAARLVFAKRGADAAVLFDGARDGCD